jgi:hypothetical protein
VGFVELGYVSPDGVTETRDRSSNQIRAWQNGDLIREVVTESTAKFQFVLMESSKAVIEAFYGATTNTTEGSLSINPNSTGGKQSFVFDIIDGTESVRVYIPAGEILEVGDQVFQHGEVIGYDVTVTAYPTAGVAYKKFYSTLKV